MPDRTTAAGVAGSLRFGALLRAFVLPTLWLLCAATADAQVRPSYSEGQGVSTAFEGRVPNDDGSADMLFGYMNENWEEELNVPVGPENFFSPGPIDRGQPTRFLPRRNRYVFRVRVPADFGEQELVWTLVTRDGATEKAYGSLARDYVLDDIVIMSETGAAGGGRGTSHELRDNIPPEIRLEGVAVRSVRVGQPLRFVVEVTDDGRPPRRGFRAPEPDATPQELFERAMRPPRQGTVGKAVGLHFTWFVYRGPGAVAFHPPQIKPWEDTRAFANSPWSAYWVPPPAPEDGVWSVEATFHEAGTYVLRGRADDGGLTDDVELTVHVTHLAN